jgi:hypothetical protein
MADDVRTDPRVLAAWGAVQQAIRDYDAACRLAVLDGFDVIARSAKVIAAKVEPHTPEEDRTMLIVETRRGRLTPNQLIGCHVDIRKPRTE